MSWLSPFIQINTKTKLSWSKLRPILHPSFEENQFSFFVFVFFFVILLTNKLTNKQTDTVETYLVEVKIYQPEMEIGQRVQHGDGHPLPDHQQQGDGHIMVALVIMELWVAFQNLQYDVNQLLLKHGPLCGWHTWEIAMDRHIKSCSTCNSRSSERLIKAWAANGNSKHTMWPFTLLSYSFKVIHHHLTANQHQILHWSYNIISLVSSACHKRLYSQHHKYSEWDSLSDKSLFSVALQTLWFWLTTQASGDRRILPGAAFTQFINY